ncbi:MAG: nitrous oxide reductase accessory protein NosL [Flavisolibacter sp.]
MNKMSSISRIVVAIASLLMIALYFVPVWFIFLLAPQYPEGLTMQIWLNQITGQVDIINGLNHYIGMKHISADMFPEFTYLVYIVGFFIAFGLLVAITGKRKLLFVNLVMLVLFGVAAMVDFYMWGYDYGHNLDPKAAIQVPGLSYQPPVIGHKTLLNFDAYSYPDIGGWILVVAATAMFIVWFLEWRKRSKVKLETSSLKKATVPAAAALLAITLNSCSTQPEPFNYGKENCDECHMTLMDPHFGAEVITKKGRIYKFDDAHCVVKFLKSGNVKQEDIAQTLFIDYNKENSFVEADKATFVTADALKSPMNSNTAAFATADAANQKAAETNGTAADWKTVYEKL